MQQTGMIDLSNIRQQMQAKVELELEKQLLAIPKMVEKVVETAPEIPVELE